MGILKESIKKLWNWVQFKKKGVTAMNYVDILYHNSIKDKGLYLFI